MLSAMALATLATSMRHPTLFRLRGGASETEPHGHVGKLRQYSLAPPDVQLSVIEQACLLRGKPVTQTTVSSDGQSRRLMVVQDVEAPCDIVLGRIMDLNKYPAMIDGVERCVTYSSSETAGVQTVKSAYEVSSCGMKLKYFMQHTFDPAARCMVFHLDYDRKSDLDDSVGYWYVAPQGPGRSRVHYSMDCKLNGWVPRPVYNMLTHEALKKATVWVERESVKEWRSHSCGRFDLVSAAMPLVRLVENVRRDVREAAREPMAFVLE